MVNIILIPSDNKTKEMWFDHLFDCITKYVVENNENPREFKRTRNELCVNGYYIRFIPNDPYKCKGLRPDYYYSNDIDGGVSWYLLSTGAKLFPDLDSVLELVSNGVNRCE